MQLARIFIPIVYQDACGRSYAGGPTTAILARLDRGYAASGIRTSENTHSTTLVNKG